MYPNRKPVKRMVLAVLGVIVAIVALWLLFAGTVTVGTGKIAVMTRFGEVTGQELGAGFHYKNPLDKANIYDVKVQKDQTDAAAASKDLQDVHATVVTNYHIQAGDVSKIHKTIGVLYKEKVIDPAVQEVFKAATAKFNATELITNRTQVKDESLKQLTDRLAKYGIVVDDLSITNFGFSPEFTQAIEQKQVAQQNAEKAQFSLQQAQLDAQAQEAQKASLSPELLQKYAIDKWDGHMPQVVSGNQGSILSIPTK